jgi:hypothetical protein
MTEEQRNSMLDKIMAMKEAGVSDEDISAIVEAYKQKLSIEEIDYGVDKLPEIPSDTSDVDYSKITEQEVDANLFPRLADATERKASGDEIIASKIGDAASLPGRVVSGLVGSVKRLLEGDLTAEEQVQAYLTDIGQTHGTDKQNVVVNVLEDIIRDPALIPSLVTGGIVGGAGKAIQTLRSFKTADRIAKAIPIATRAAQGSVAGVTDIAVQDALNDYAMDEDKINTSDYALGATGGAVMPFAADKAKKFGDKLYKTMKEAKAVPVPPKQFSQFKPAQESFGIGADDIGLKGKEGLPDNWREQSELLDDYSPTEPMIDKDGILNKKVSSAPDWVGDIEEFKPGSNELVDKTLSDMLKQSPSKIFVDLAEIGESKMAPFLNKTVRGYNTVAEPVVNFGVDMANLINKPLYGGYNLEQKGAAASVRGLAAPMSDMLKNSAYRLPTDLTILKENIEEE